jgi:hypothetical protein
MVERLVRIHEAQGSIPCSSTFYITKYFMRSCASIMLNDEQLEKSNNAFLAERLRR